MEKLYLQLKIARIGLSLRLRKLNVSGNHVPYPWPWLLGNILLNTFAFLLGKLK